MNDFLLYDNGRIADSILMFPIDDYSYLIAKSDIWFVVGIVGLVRAFFKQLYIIRVQIN